MMRSILLSIFALVVLWGAAPAEAACAGGADAANQVTTRTNTDVLFTGNCTTDNDVLIITSDIRKYSSCALMSTAGAVDVLVSLDGTTYATAPLSLTDQGATTEAPVLVTVAERIYALPQFYRAIMVLQNGATAATAHLLCKK